jgi:pimeloyl-ACP methyl ester carboxylesterase
MRPGSVVLSVLAVAFVGTLAFGAWKNPEKVALDDAARAGAPGEFVRLPAGVTHYEIAGPDSGRVVVLVHGFSVPYYIWDSTFVGLTGAGYRVLRYDLIGRGLSDRPDVDYDGALYDGQLEGLLDSLGIRGPVDLVGLSFGGFVTAHFVTTHPTRVRTLTLVDPQSSGDGAPAIFRLPLIGPWIWQVLHMPGAADGQMTDFLHPENHPTWVAQYRPQMRYKGLGHALLSTTLMTGRVDFDRLYGDVARTGIPVMLIWGKQDRTIDISESQVVRRAIPSVEFVPVDSAGHVSHIEQAALVNARIAAFLEVHPRPTN